MSEQPEWAQRAARTLRPALDAYRSYSAACGEAYHVPRPGWAKGENYCVGDHEAEPDCRYCGARI